MTSIVWVVAPLFHRYVIPVIFASSVIFWNWHKGKVSSVDGINFQNSNTFFDVPGGLQTAYVREKNGCGQTAQNFVVLVFPAFFTPNNDSYNDLWEVTGMENYPQAEVTIFDRYGKLIAQLTSSKMSWDGTLNKIPLPASDYWYALKIDDTKPILRGHFSLKR